MEYVLFFRHRAVSRIHSSDSESSTDNSSGSESESSSSGEDEPEPPKPDPPIIDTTPNPLLENQEKVQWINNI